MTIEQILNLPYENISRLKESELRSYTQILASAGNKRLKRAKEQGFESVSIRAVEQRGKFSTAGKNYGQLMTEFSRAKRFLESKTGTLQAFNKFRAESIRELEKQAGIKISKEQFDVFWRTYENLRKQDPSIAEKGMKYALLEQIDEKQKDNATLDVDELSAQLSNRLGKIYEEQQANTMQAEDNATELRNWKNGGAAGNEKSKGTRKARAKKNTKRKK